MVYIYNTMKNDRETIFILKKVNNQFVEQYRTAQNGKINRGSSGKIMTTKINNHKLISISDKYEDNLLKILSSNEIPVSEKYDMILEWVSFDCGYKPAGIIKEEVIK